MVERDEMDDLDIADLERRAQERRERREQDLWHALEGEGVVPDRADLRHLSGLLEENTERVRTLWNQLRLEVRQELVETLRQMAEAEFRMDFSAVFRIALCDEDAEIRATATRGLSEVEDVRLVPLLADMLRHDPSSEVRLAAAEVLARYVLLGELQKIRPAPFAQAMQALRESYTDPAETGQIRRQAMESMAYTGDYDVPALIAEAYEQDEEAMRVSAVLAMGRSADARWGDVVRRELHSPNPVMRLEATRACGELQLREAVQEVAELTDDVDSKIREMALWSLGQIGGSIARKTLERYAGSAEATMQQAAVEALEELEFYYGDLTTFFGPPADYSGEADEVWQVPGFFSEEDVKIEIDDEASDDEDSDEAWS
ncbi:MAG: HEAT repeat domain-containing protein [Anaerolineae bacterium]